jgi:hypothetical protein
MLHGLNTHSYPNRRTNNTRWNNSSRNNDPERMRHGLNSYRQNDGFSRNGNFRGNGNFWSNRTERNERRRSDSFRRRPSERTPWTLRQNSKIRWREGNIGWTTTTTLTVVCGAMTVETGDTQWRIEYWMLIILSFKSLLCW